MTFADSESVTNVLENGPHQLDSKSVSCVHFCRTCIRHLCFHETKLCVISWQFVLIPQLRSLCRTCCNIVPLVFLNQVRSC